MNQELTVLLGTVGMREVPDQRDEGERATTRPTIALAIPWCPWLVERVESMARLRAALGVPPPPSPLDDTIGPVDVEGLTVTHRTFGERASNDVWSEQVFEWLAATASDGGFGSPPVDWCLEIQEDAFIPENFWRIVRAILEALPPEAEIIGFHVVTPVAPAFAAHDVRLLTTTDALVGLCWAMRGPTMLDFVEWRRTKLRDGWRQQAPGPQKLPHITEDTMIGLFGMATGRRIWHPIPAIVDHDTSMRSVHGNDHHVNRRPAVTWRDAERFGGAWDARELESPNFWRGGRRRVPLLAPDGRTLVGWRTGYNTEPQTRAPGDVGQRHIGRHYDATPALARRWVEGFTEADYVRARQDTGEPVKKHMHHVQLAAAGPLSPRAQILVCTPTRGGTDPRYTSAMLALARAADVDVVDGLDLLSTWRWHEQLVTVRSRFVRAFLETAATHLLFVDADVIPTAEAVAGMMRAKRGFVACPYPRRDKVDWLAVRTAMEAGHGEESIPAEAVAYDYPVRLLPGAESAIDEHGCVPVASAPLGCALLSRGLLERMTAHYAAIDAKRVDVDLVQNELQEAEAEGRDALVARDMLGALASELLEWRAGRMGLPFTDIDDGARVETVALFALATINRPDLGSGARVLSSEDASFCQRVRDMGETVWLYLGPGSPVDHVGEHVYRGHVEAFGIKRAPRP